MSHHASVVEQRRRWAYDRLRLASSPPPSYGSPEWLELADTEPGKLAGLIVAAEAWARDGDDLEIRLRAEVELARRAHKDAEDAEYAAQAAAHRERWGRRGQVLPFAQRRSRQIDGARPRASDFEGGPVEWGGDAS